MDRVTQNVQPAQEERGVDWFSFHQGPGQRGPERHPQGPRPGHDPYDNHQGPRQRRNPDDTNRPERPRKPEKHRLTLYEVAEGTLKKESKKYSQDDIYFRLNDMMVAHGHKKANIDGRKNINDHMLPRSWNYVDPRSLLEAPKPKDPPAPKNPDDGKDNPKEPPQTPQEKARDDYQKQVEASLQEKFALPPIEKGKGYYDSVAKAHPDWKPQQVLDEARRVRGLNDNRVDLKVGERVWTISKEERAKLIQQAMDEYDRSQQ